MWLSGTHKQVYSHKEDNRIVAVDFDPRQTYQDGDSDENPRLLVGSIYGTATVFDLVTRLRVLGPLRHVGVVRAAKYSPQGDRIAIATPDSVRVYDSKDGRLLVNINVTVTVPYNRGLVWSDRDHLFLLSDGEIKQIEASTGSAVSKWPIPDTNDSSYICKPELGYAIVCSANHTVTFWDMRTHAQFDLIQHTQEIYSIAFLDRFLAIAGKDGKITIKFLGILVDYDRQCGVINDKGLPCSRSLTCKAHSMGAKRAVQGRPRPYDELLLEWNRANNPTEEGQSDHQPSTSSSSHDNLNLLDSNPVGIHISVSKTTCAHSLVVYVHQEVHGKPNPLESETHSEDSDDHDDDLLEVLICSSPSAKPVLTTA